MKTRKNDEYWPPRPGSWEEAVDPYDVQWSKQSAKDQDEDQDVPIEMMTDHRSNYRMPASVS